MKNVTKILTAAVLCAALFASTDRTDALGGNPAFWPGDEANIAAFPAQVNNHSFLQLDGVGCSTWDDDGECTSEDTGGASLLINKDGTAWGFNYAGGSTDWANMSWGNGDMGFTIGLESSTQQEEETSTAYTSCDCAGAGDQAAIDACTAAETTTAALCTGAGGSAVNTTTVDTEQSGSDESDISIAWGGSFGDIGEFGVKYATVDNGDGDATLAVNWRKDCGFWIFDNSVVSVTDLMADDLAFTADMFSHHDAGGADVMFAWGIDYDGSDTGGIDQTAAIGVEANMTDWATLRAGYNWTHELTCEGTDDCGNNTGVWAWGLGFNWGGLTADMSVSSSLLQDPVGTITGNNDDAGGLTSSAITLTYSF
jgi:hypothetical protein